MLFIVNKNELTSPFIRVWHKVSIAVKSPLYIPSLSTASPIFSVPRSPKIGALPETTCERLLLLSGFSVLSEFSFDEFSEDFSEDPPSELLLEPLDEPPEEPFEGLPEELEGEIVGFNPPKIARFPHSLVVK